MANTLTAVIPKLLAQGLLALREMAIMPRLVNRAYESTAGQRGSSIDVPIPSAIAAVAVAPANVPPTTADIGPTSVNIPLDQWWEAPFYLDDKEELQVQEGTIPMQASEAVRTLANKVDSHVLGLYTKFYGFFGTPAVTPFGTPGVADATGIRKILNKQLAPMDPRHAVLNPDAEAAALGLEQFANSVFSGSVEAIVAGRLNQKLGFSWWMDQLTPTHTAGTLSDGTGHKALVNGALTAGTKTMNIDSTTLTGTVVPGDIFSFANHTQTYVVTNAAVLTASANAIAGITFEPALQINVADNAVVTFKDTHVVNLAFHRDAIALATRPLTQETEGLGAITRSAADPVSGLTLRLEVTREHKRRRYSYDILWGAEVVRRELGARLAG